MKKMVLHGSILALSLGLAACVTQPGLLNDDIKVSNEMKDAMKTRNAESALFITKDGQLGVVKASGKPLQKCRAPGGRDLSLPLCKSFQKGTTVKFVGSVTLVRTQINPYCDCWVDPYGNAWEDCDPH